MVKLVVPDIDVLRDYLTGVMERADHHARGVDQIALALAGAIIWRKNGDPLQVATRDGETKNVLWVTFEELARRFAFSYDHETGQIVMKENSTHGQVAYAFDNDMALAELKGIFEAL